MRKFRELEDRNQVTLLPRSVEEYVGEGDLVRYVDAMVTELDLSEIEREYSSFGRPAYNPRVLVKILIYGKMRGMRSSRELSRACSENLRFIFLASTERPDFRTISDFRKKFHEELSGLLKQTIKIGVEEGLINLEHVAIDGTKVAASAGRSSFRKPKHLKKLLKRVEEALGGSFEEDIEEDEREDALYGEQEYEPELPESLREKEALRAKIKKALKHYDEIEGEKPKQVSTTDPESRFMKSKGINPSYTGLAAVDAESRLVVAGYATNAVSDNSQLIPCLEEIESNTGKNPQVLSADKGFRELKGLAELERRQIDGYVPQHEPYKNRFNLSDFQYDESKDCYRCPAKKVLHRKTVAKGKHVAYQCNECEGCALLRQCLPHGEKRRTLAVSIHQSLADEMIKKTMSEIGKEMAKVRGATIEPLFGYLKASKKLRQFLFRGLNMINAMWRFELAAYNLEKLAKFRQQTQMASAI